MEGAFYDADVDALLARGLRASLRLNGGDACDEELEEHALAPGAVDRLMDGECLVQQLAEDAPFSCKKRRVDSGGGGAEPDAEPEEGREELTACAAVDDDDCTAAGDDDGTDALLAELGDGTWHVDDDEDVDAVADALRLVAASGQDKRLLRTDSCCSTFSFTSSTGGGGGGSGDVSDGANNANAATRAKVCQCGRFGAGEPFLHHSAAKDYLDLHVRYGISVCVTEVDVVDSHTRFTLRVVDSETQRAWEVRKSSSEMVAFYHQVKKISMEDAPVKRDLWGSFRGLRRFHLPKSFFHSRGALLHQRKVVFDSFLRQTAALVAPAPLGPRRRRAVLLLQEFCGVHRHCEVFERAACSCFRFSHQANASQLVAEIFATPSHAVYQECERFAAALTRSSRDARHSKLTPRKARAILKAIARKMTELKKLMFEDENLRRQLTAARDERDDDDEDHEEFLEEIRHAVCAFVEKHVLVPLEDHVYEALHTMYPDEDELRLKNKLRVMQAKGQRCFGVPAHLVSPDDWEDARRELRQLNEYALPLDKLKCIVRSASAIFRSCVRAAGSASSLTSVDQLAPAITTDEFIAVHLFVVVNSATVNLLVTKELLRLMCDYHDATGEIGYYLTNFEVAIDLIERHHNPLRPMFE